MLVFLDIDGVLVPARGWKSPDLLDDGFPAFSEKAVRALNRILAEGCRVVLTTSHKSSYSIVEWKRIFEIRGINIEHLDMLPANSDRLSRREELVNWFINYKGDEAFIILDDDTGLNDLPRDLKDHLIQTSPFIGLTEDHVAAAKVLLHPPSA